MTKHKALFRLLSLAACFAAGTASAAPDKSPAQHEASVSQAWNHFKKRFITPDGRVIDHYQNDISHSEGQGYAMLLAERHGERELFDALWSWTRNNLQVRRDGLLAWSWGQRANGKWNVLDYNNASDGDLLVALALSRSGQRWKNPAYSNEAKRLATTLRENLAVEAGERSYLLTGYFGFAGKDGLVLNPSYQISSAYRALAALDNKAFWDKIDSDGGALLRASCENTIGLPADWVSVQAGKITPAANQPARFGYEAIRVFLYADWLDPYAAPCGAERLLDSFARHQRLFGWYALNGKETAPDEASAGYYAVASRVAERLGNLEAAKRLRETALAKIQNEPDSYYSHVLFLLALPPH